LSNNLVFVKLGGAAITHKNVAKKANIEVMNQAAKELSEVCKNNKLLVGHGGGSFPHHVAAEYKVQEGLDVCGAEGFVETQRAVLELNKLVMNALHKQKVSAVSVQTSAFTINSNGAVKDMCPKSLQEYIKNGFVPVVFGDVVLDETKGCSIASTEMIFKHLAPSLKPKRIVIGTDVDGVFTKDPKKGKGELIKEISEANIEEVLKLLEPAPENDVTGGMAHKVKELYELSKLGMEVKIINLTKQGLLKNAILGENCKGTLIIRNEKQDLQ